MLQVLKQPVNLNRGLRVMDGDAIVHSLRVDDELTDTGAQLMKSGLKGFGGGSELSGFEIHETIFKLVVVPDERGMVRVKESPPDRPHCPLLFQAFLARQFLSKVRA